MINHNLHDDIKIQFFTSIHNHNEYGSLMAKDNAEYTKQTKERNRTPNQEDNW